MRSYAQRYTEYSNASEIRCKVFVTHLTTVDKVTSLAHTCSYPTLASFPLSLPFPSSFPLPLCLYSTPSSVLPVTHSLSPFLPSLLPPRVCADVVAGVVTKCLNARPKSKDAGINICLMLIEAEQQAVVQVSYGQSLPTTCIECDMIHIYVYAHSHVQSSSSLGVSSSLGPPQAFNRGLGP